MIRYPWPERMLGGFSQCLELGCPERGKGVLAIEATHELSLCAHV
jgi:hypothetical protein